MLAVTLLFMGQFALFTYVRPFLETVTGVHGATISLILLAIGAAGFVGTLLIGRALQRGFYQTLIVIPLLYFVAYRTNTPAPSSPADLISNPSEAT